MNQNNDEQVVYFGETDARNRRLKFGIKKKDRSRHLYAIGKTGMGKSTLLENLAVQDILNGDGLCFIDPHGKSADLLLEYVPEHRIKDVIYFAPFDMDYPVSFNVMEDVGPERRYLVASGLMAAFKKIWVDAWSARMEYILGNIMLALLEYPGSTLVGVNRMLTDKDFRKEVVNNITDPSVKSFWVNEYASYTDKFAAEAAPAIQNKVGQFIANPLIRNIIGQEKSSFDIRDVMDKQKILIINLSKGRVGEANANLLGSMLITKIYLGAMSRADLGERQLAEAPNFYLYVDEFQSFANESFADILSEARKYKLNLCIAHQYIEQMTDEVRAAVFGNVGTMVAYRVGAYDAEVLEKEFAPFFTAEDIVNLQKYQMYLKLMIDGVTSKPFSASGMPPIPRPEINYTNDILASSRSLYARPRQQVEDELLSWIQKKFGGSGGGSSGGSGASGNTGGNSGNSSGSNSGNFAGNRGDNRNNQGRQNQGGQRQGSFASGGGQSGQFGQSRDRDRDRDRGSNSGQNRPQNAPQSQRGGRSDQGVMHTANVPTQARDQDGQTQNHKTSDSQSSGQREQELRKAMSLSYLKTEQQAQPKQEKTPKPENIAALREALLSVMKVEDLQPKNESRTGSTGESANGSADGSNSLSKKEHVKEETVALPKRDGPQSISRSQSEPQIQSQTQTQNSGHTHHDKGHDQKSGHQNIQHTQNRNQGSHQNQNQNNGQNQNSQKHKPKENEVGEDVLKNVFSDL